SIERDHERQLGGATKRRRVRASDRDSYEAQRVCPLRVCPLRVCPFSVCPLPNVCPLLSVWPLLSVCPRMSGSLLDVSPAVDLGQREPSVVKKDAMQAL